MITLSMSDISVIVLAYWMTSGVNKKIVSQIQNSNGES